MALVFFWAQLINGKSANTWKLAGKS